VSREIFLEELIEWLNARLAPPGVTIGPDTPLFVGGMIDSIRILELIAWTERATESVIPDRMILTDNFRTPRRIRDVFMKEERNAIR
jgi:acyl carrier protein